MALKTTTALTRTLQALALAGGLAMTVSASAPAFARDHWHGGYHGGWHGDYGAWRHGYWNHGWRGDRFGWWWTVGPDYYYYAEPVYPYPDPYVPPAVIVQAPPQPTGVPPAQSWYYCDSPKGYYPYVSSCSVEWRQVPVTPPGE